MQSKVIPVASSAARRGPCDQPAPVRRGTSSDEGHGRRLTIAFEALEQFPVLAEARARLLTVAGGDRVDVADVVGAIESDLALVVAVLRLANNLPGKQPSTIETIVDAVHALTAEAVSGLAQRARTFDFFERTAVWDGAPERVRLHGLATRAAADRLATEIGYEPRERLMVAALLHDIGKLVLTHAYAGYPDEILGNARTPEERIRQERRQLGVDHAMVGGVLARRWGLPNSIASAIEHHHSDHATGDAAVVRVADMLAHYALDGAVSPGELLKTARTLGIDTSQLRAVMFNLPSDGAGARRRTTEPCPLSARELDVVRHLAEGKVYKQIALEMHLATSTVRTHLHNAYGKLGAVDRAQAVLTATEKGWLD